MSHVLPAVQFNGVLINALNLMVHKNCNVHPQLQRWPQLSRSMICSLLRGENDAPPPGDGWYLVDGFYVYESRGEAQRRRRRAPRRRGAGPRAAPVRVVPRAAAPATLSSAETSVASECGGDVDSDQDSTWSFGQPPL
eukprot:TRINITY_DN27044_c0_g7_i1.p1 TRINITY_DN27044_c0_g7~~TRINITY_DN27044_c0_g7_i1.p1  ORF type:complete len:138 (+),score=17.36 TRINITY_DN27044_c0_g7_i1:136-549(+)